MKSLPKIFLNFNNISGHNKYVQKIISVSTMINSLNSNIKNSNYKSICPSKVTIVFTLKKSFNYFVTIIRMISIYGPWNSIRWNNFLKKQDGSKPIIFRQIMTIPKRNKLICKKKSLCDLIIYYFFLLR